VQGRSDYERLRRSSRVGCVKNLEARISATISKRWGLSL